MLELIFSGYLAITLMVCFVRIKLGIAMYLIYNILVPYVAFFSFGANFFSFAILIALTFNYGVKSLVYWPLAPFLFLFIGQLILTPLHDALPVSVQLENFRTDFMWSFLLPFAMINVMIKDMSAVKLYTKTLILTVIIASIYSLFLTTSGGFNPYLMTVMPLTGREFNEAYSVAEDGGRVFGRISGVFSHPMTNGLFLCLSFLFILSMIDLKKIFSHKIFLVILFIVLTAIVFIGVRSAIVALGLAISFFLILERKFKLVFICLIGLFILAGLILYIPGMDDFAVSIFDTKSSNVKGSSLEMRLEQLDGAFEIIRYNYLFGQGYGWTDNYRASFGVHPKLLAFESLLFVVIINHGIIGLFIWIGMFFLYRDIIYKNFFNSSRTPLLTLLLTYLIYSLITGEYGYMKYFLIFYAIMYMNEKVKKYSTS